MSELSGVVAPTSRGDGRYTASIDASWNVVRFPQGGVVVSLGLRAAMQEVADEAQVLRSASTVFAGPVAPGELDIEVTTLRRGRSATQVSVTVRNSGSAAGATTTAVFGASRRGPSFVEVAPPSVRPPMECPSYRDPPPEGISVPDFGPFWKRVEGRSAIGHAPWERFTPTSSDVATWLRFDDPPRQADGTLDPLAALILADRMPGCVAERMGNDGPVWFAPSADLTVHLFGPLRSEWLLAHDRARWADDGWASVETTLWDEGGVPVGYATQVVFFTYLE